MEIYIIRRPTRVVLHVSSLRFEFKSTCEEMETEQHLCHRLIAKEFKNNYFD